MEIQTSFSVGVISKKITHDFSFVFLYCKYFSLSFLREGLGGKQSFERVVAVIIQGMPNSEDEKAPRLQDSGLHT